MGEGEEEGTGSGDGDLSLPIGLALGSPIFPSGCEGKLGVALEQRNFCAGLKVLALTPSHLICVRLSL